ncbi:MAG: response regulator [Dehalococcoidia bacterium]
MLEQQAPDMIILDIMMPSLDGIEVCLRLRQWLPGVLRDFLPGRETRAY